VRDFINDEAGRRGVTYRGGEDAMIERKSYQKITIARYIIRENQLKCKIKPQ
jgi:hypothetical protein